MEPRWKRSVLIASLMLITCRGLINEFPWPAIPRRKTMPAEMF
jgi:hypothetical protein